MKQNDVLKKLAANRNELEALGVSSLALFGSVARDEALDTSDVDILIEFDTQVGLFHFAHVKRRLSEILGCSVDLVTRAALRDEMKEEILRELVNAN